jgi:hypothetical protein
MAYRLAAFSDLGLDEALLKLLIAEHTSSKKPRLDRYWTYYRNPLKSACTDDTTHGPWYRQAQELGLPSRIVGRAGFAGANAVQGGRREVVVENDIAWRIQAMVDFMFAKPVTLLSSASDESKRREIERALDHVWEASGGIGLFQDMALLGHVYGHVDLAVRVDPSRKGVDAVSIEVIHPTRGIPILDPADYRTLHAYVVHFERAENAAARQSLVQGALSMLNPRKPSPTSSSAQRERSAVTEILSRDTLHVYLNEKLVREQSLEWTNGQIPVVHIQNISEPFRYEGLGEVEPLIPLQDELNTRLSDRASRVTMQSFKMYLARGIDGFEKSPVGPGMMWSTDNLNASIQEFGGDTETPGESAHIQEIREALDKVSAVPPLASGVVRARIGNLTSATALRVTLMGLLSKTSRKRITYGRGIERASALALAALNHLGILKTGELDRDVRLEWPDPLPIDDTEAARAAEAKLRIGVPHERVMGELGYAPGDVGIT